jgi:hypothetical protein
MSLSYPVLSLVNYMGWAIKVQTILDAQGLWEVVALANGANVDECKNKMAMAQLLQSLPEDNLMQVSTKPMAKRVWRQPLDKVCWRQLCEGCSPCYSQGRV